LGIRGTILDRIHLDIKIIGARPASNTPEKSPAASLRPGSATLRPWNVARFSVRVTIGDTSPFK
jgi:hypothetical protein